MLSSPRTRFKRGRRLELEAEGATESLDERPHLRFIEESARLEVLLARLRVS